MVCSFNFVGLPSHFSSSRYYYNKKTRQSSWEKPAELMTPLEVTHAVCLHAYNLFFPLCCYFFCGFFLSSVCYVIHFLNPSNLCWLLPVAILLWTLLCSDISTLHLCTSFLTALILKGQKLEQCFITLLLYFMAEFSNSIFVKISFLSSW
jgi:hypothetical protein